MEFIDLAQQQRRIKEKIDANIGSVLSHGQYINGPEVQKLEKALAAYVGSRHAIGCASGTDALLLGLMALGVGPGDAVFTTPFTFIATAEVISLLGAVPVFVDIDPRSFNLDPEQLDVAIHALREQNRKVYPLPAPAVSRTINPRGIIGVDLFGVPADYGKINRIAEKYNLFVIEDAAQSFGAEYAGKKACSLSKIGCTSFFPAKPLGCYGDGGMCFTDNGNLAEIMGSLRVHGKGQDKYDNVRIGINGRLDTLQAAILLAKFEVFPREIELRQAVAQRYTELLAENGEITTPWVPEEMKSAWAQYSVLLKSEAARKSCQARMTKDNVPSAIYYPKPLHLQTAFYGLGYKEGDFPVSEDFAKRILSLPMHPYLTPEDQAKVARAIAGGE
jgi:UDP-2-acetamido-2-deoxy-ribo-hexuluronate aminotransferase